MRLIATLGALGMLAALGIGCSLDTGESGPGPAAEPVGMEEQAFDASLFKFSPYVLDDHQGESGGWQRASAVLSFSDSRESILSPYLPRSGAVGSWWRCRSGSATT